jgi:DNA-binding beta-propeller fold protein YncE
VSVDPQGHIYAVDALFDNIQIFDNTGRLLLTLGGSGSQPGEFWLPNGIAISPNNEIYATDAYNHRVQVFQYVGPL